MVSNVWSAWFMVKFNMEAVQQPWVSIYLDHLLFEQAWSQLGVVENVDLKLLSMQLNEYSDTFGPVCTHTWEISKTHQLYSQYLSGTAVPAQKSCETKLCTQKEACGVIVQAGSKAKPMKIAILCHFVVFTHVGSSSVAHTDSLFDLVWGFNILYFIHYLGWLLTSISVGWRSHQPDTYLGRPVGRMPHPTPMASLPHEWVATWPWPAAWTEMVFRAPSDLVFIIETG